MKKLQFIVVLLLAMSCQQLAAQETKIELNRLKNEIDRDQIIVSMDDPPGDIKQCIINATVLVFIDTKHDTFSVHANFVSNLIDADSICFQKKNPGTIYGLSLNGTGTCL